MRIHFIAIGGSIMHSLALALHRDGHRVSGSDDEIYEPARTRLRDVGILPEIEGWSLSRITPDLDAVILGMHARSDNVELQEAQRLHLPIFSFPEFLSQRSINKRRVVVAGSHGKTTTTSAIMHALRADGRPFDFMVGSKVPGFDHQVQLTNAPVIVLEGDEYLSSATDPRPKFLHYNPQVCIITGMAWDHMNVFPTLEIYERQFRLLMESMEPAAKLIINSGDMRLVTMAESSAKHLDVISYSTPGYVVVDDAWHLKHDGSDYQLRVFGKHNMENLVAASLACEEIGLDQATFFSAMRDFAGPARRLELLKSNGHSALFNDFAHAPSKVKATIEAAREQFPKRRLIAVLELHTYSSLNREFLAQYRHTANEADVFIVFLNAHAMKQKGLNVSAQDVTDAFGRPDTVIVTSAADIPVHLPLPLKESTLLMMSSGNFDGLDLKALANLAIT